MISKWRSRKYLVGLDRGIFEGTVPAFAWKEKWRSQEDNISLCMTTVPHSPWSSIYVDQNPQTTENGTAVDNVVNSDAADEEICPVCGNSAATKRSEME
jgi:hypothetical protein